ncbi:MAG: hypothetical protein U0892_16555 [Pirellulales bacterium]
MAIHDALGSTGSNEVVSIPGRAGRRAVLLRMRSPAGLNYHELYLVKDRDGLNHVDDLLDYGTGSTLVGRMTLELLAIADRSGSVQPENAAAGGKEKYEVARRLMDLNDVGKTSPEEIEEAILSWPTELQDTQLAATARLQSVWKMDVGRQWASLAHYRSKCGEDIASYLYEFNMCRDQNQIFEAVPAAMFLDRNFPGDPEVNEILKFSSQILRRY